MSNSSYYHLQFRVDGAEPTSYLIKTQGTLGLHLYIDQVPEDTISDSHQIIDPQNILTYAREIVEGKWEIKSKDDQSIIYFPTGRPFIKSPDFHEDYIHWCRTRRIIPIRTFSQQFNEYFPGSRSMQSVDGKMCRGFFLDVLYNQPLVTDQS